MQARLPTDEKLRIETRRLVLEPILAGHAREMAFLLKDQDLYNFVPQDPPALEELEKTYRFWSQRISPTGDELWLNWVARMKSTGEAIGHFQAGVKEGPDSNLGYTVGRKFQRQGFASEALRGILSFLGSEIGIKSIKAWIDTRNIPSIALVEKLGMIQVGLVKNADNFKGTVSDEFVYEFTFGQ
jgi:ribosomal-protein-alanine N-acetyltransferase